MKAGYKISHCKIFSLDKYITVNNWDSRNEIDHSSWIHYPKGLKGVSGVVGIWKLKNLKK